MYIVEIQLLRTVIATINPYQTPLHSGNNSIIIDVGNNMQSLCGVIQILYS